MGFSDNTRGAFFMSLAMLAFAVNDTFMKAVTTDLPLFQTILLRGLLTCGALLLIAPRMGGIHLRMSRRDGVLVAWRSVGEIFATLTFLTALRNMPLANLSAIMQALPLAVTLAAALFLKEPVGWRRMAAILVGFAGVLLIVRPGTDGFSIWSLVGLASVAFVVLRDLSTRRLSGNVTSVSVSFFASTSVSLMAACLIPFEGWATVTAWHMAYISTASLFLIGGYLTVVMAMRVGEISLVAPFRYMALIFSIVLGWIAFNDFPGPVTLLGAGIVVASGIYTFYRERRIGRQVAVPTKATLRVR